jgi:UDP-N-acetylmuramate dehydrogenase
MKVAQNASLKSLNSLGVAARCRLLLTIETEEDLLSSPALDPARDLVLGGGSNVVFVTDVPGTVFLNRIRGVAVIEEHDDHVLIETGAGENWHELVLWSLDRGLCGLENLSLIPGLAGAAPVQNIGAYGVELSSVLDCVTAWDLSRGHWTVFEAEQCRLAYRDSRFRSEGANRYLITSLRLRLNRHFKPELGYGGLKEELQAVGIDRPTARDVSEAVIRLRRRKLPDPAVQGNAGSFFKNPLIERDRADDLLRRFPGLPAWPAADGSCKLSAAWMIEHCGLKGLREGDAGVSERHALVLVNHGAATGEEFAVLARRVRCRVLDTFGVDLEPEPVLIEF